ncbi:MAG: rod shape-determining protein MreC, partial [Clostridia bacterium]|nr:rod shape-determining protein MreC [Clostridia bacterium]
LSTLQRNRASVFENAFNTLFSPVQKTVTGMADGVSGFFGFLFEMQDYKKVNDDLTKRIADLEQNYRSTEEIAAENVQLKALLDLQEEAYDDYQSTGAKIIGWSSDNWYNTYTINKGSLSGIKAQDMVVTELGLVGQVQEVGLNWARVTTLVDTASTVGVCVVRTGDVAMLDGDTELGKDGMCKLNFVNKQAEIVVGDMLETSGLGEVFASGIAVGRVAELHADSTGVNQYAVVEPAVDFAKTRYVLVLKKN